MKWKFVFMWMVVAAYCVIDTALLGFIIPGIFNTELTSREKIELILKDSPLIDGHNDLAWNIRNIADNQLHRFDFSKDLRKQKLWNKSIWSHTDIPRLRKGLLGAVFWVAWVRCDSQYRDAVKQTMEQIDIVERLIDTYHHDLEFVKDAYGIEEAHLNSKIAGLLGVEGGHSIGNSLAVLRLYYKLGVRYMSLTHTCNTPWADSSIVDDADNITTRTGLSDFGKAVIVEMNRIGMMVDLSHASEEVTRQALTISKAPVIFSHSSAYAICNNSRNVKDDILKMLKTKDGIVMVNFYPGFISCGRNSSANATIQDVVEHINHIRTIAGIDHVGLGSDFDGINETPIGLEDVSHFPDLLVALLETGKWSDEDIKKVAGRNFLRVFRSVEEVRRMMEKMNLQPLETLIPQDDLEGYQNCSSPGKDDSH